MIGKLVRHLISFSKDMWNGTKFTAHHIPHYSPPPVGTNTFCKRSVDTLHNGVDIITQIQRQKDEKMLRLCRHISKSVSTRVVDSGNQTTQVDALSGQVDTGSVPRTVCFKIWAVCRHHHQGRSTHYGKFAT
ncbi:hypothetical protein Taro_050490 [Colocasia esculenta]|uniref:Uncharacterized protein n=1 Tax=Colocasia esculenta TaxID=4460 RepID=A0A843XDK4_COLES|nr:hypothetical protein [Colocasia esculenta]